MKRLALLLITLVTLLCFAFTNTHLALAANYGDGAYGTEAYGVGEEEQPTFGSVGAPTCNDTAPSSAPILLSAVPKGSSQIQLTFSGAGEPVSYYALEFGRESGKYEFSAANIGDKNTRIYTVNSLSANSTYYFRVRAGNGCMPGAWSNPLSAKTKAIISTNSLDTTEITITPIEPSPSPTTKEKGKPAPSPTPKATSAGYTVTVSVLDTQNEPIEGAEVTLHSEPKVATTDENGLAQFEDVEPGEHKLLIAYDNYSGEQSIFLEGDVKEFKITITVEARRVGFSREAIIVIALLSVITIVLLALLIRRKK